MKVEDVPQDNNKTFKGYSRKIAYALDEDGNYVKVPYSGWEIEEIALQDVVDDFNQDAETAKKKILNNETSPIEYFMYKNFMDLCSLSCGVGFSKRKIKRHLNPKVYNKLNDKTLKTYADFFKIDVYALTHLKNQMSE